MIFEKTMQTVKDFESAMTAAQESFNAAKKEILATYKDPISTDKVKAIRDILSDTEIKEKQNARDNIKADFADVRSKVNAVVTASAPADFAATLEALKTMGKSVSDYEANAFIEKYKDNYTAFRAILDVLHSVGKANDIVPYNAEAIDREISEAEKFILDWVATFKGADYYSALLTSDQHSPVKGMAVRVQAFLDGGYVLGDEPA